MIAINQNRIKEIHKEFKSEIEEQRKKALNNLINIDLVDFNVNEKAYLKKVIELFSNNKIITAFPSELSTFIDSFDGIFLDTHSGIPTKELKDEIIKALNYSGLRSDFYPKYFKSIGIKSCVYCNSQLTISVEKSDGKFSGKFDVDHYYPKSIYPFLSISLFNLYPVCSSCNRAKGNKKIDFELYIDEIEKTNKSDFTFRLETFYKAKYLVNKIPDRIKTRLVTKNDSFKTFHIEEIYDTQNDLVEDMIIRYLIYNRVHKKLLKESFNKLAIPPKYYKRFLVGNYAEVHEIHKRPMSKFMQDIAKELGIIE